MRQVKRKPSWTKSRWVKLSLVIHFLFWEVRLVCLCSVPNSWLWCCGSVVGGRGRGQGQGDSSGVGVREQHSRDSHSIPPHEVATPHSPSSSSSSSTSPSWFDVVNICSFSYYCSHCCCSSSWYIKHPLLQQHITITINWHHSKTKHVTLQYYSSTITTIILFNNNNNNNNNNINNDHCWNIFLFCQNG